MSDSDKVWEALLKDGPGPIHELGDRVAEVFEHIRISDTRLLFQDNAKIES